MDYLLSARWVLPISSQPFKDGAIRVRDGRIVACGPRREVEAEATECRRVDFGEAALLPGFVNVHTHLELTALRGYVEELDFFRWIRKVSESKYERLSPEELLVSARWGVLEATRAGITSVGEACDIGVAREALVGGGLRGVLYQEIFGPDRSEADQKLDGLMGKLALHRAGAGNRLTVGVSPHAPYTVSDVLFEKVAEVAQENHWPLCVHAAESRAERDLMLRGEGPFAEFLHGRGIDWEPPKCSTVAYLEGLGILGDRTLVVHGIDCSIEDLERLAAQRAAVAHCPKSNAKLGHGIAPLREMLGVGIRVGLGSDSVVSNNRCDLLEEGRLASFLLRARSHDGDSAWVAGDTLRLLTLSGAECLGIDADCGSLEVGKSADVIAVDLSAPHAQPVHDVEAALAWSATASDVVFTMVEGEVLYERGRFAKFDEDDLRKELGRVSAKLHGAP